MQRSTACLFGLVAFACCIWKCTSNDALPQVVDFNVHIRPILSDRCFACHGPDANTREADLSLHTQEGAYATLEAGEKYVIKPGHADLSDLYQRITSSDPDYQMPPPKSNLSITDHERALIRKWIQQGAKWEKHWSFIPPVKSKIPADNRWAKTPIDRFVANRMEQHQLRPNDAASKAKLIRRVFLDLTGLPPNLEQIEAFEADQSEAAYEKVVDMALASPAYGERMASNWLDVARYADSHGYQDDRQRTMWPWRDWVIKAFNENMPYDQFVTYQLAGDLLPNAGYEQKLATGFNRNHAITQEGGVINEEYLTEYAADRTDVFATAFLGLTMQCARCHDHKYDPITQEEFYQTFAFFNNLKDERGQISYFDLAPTPSIPMEDSAHLQEINRIKKAIANLETEVAGDGDPDLYQTWKKELKSIAAANPAELGYQFALDEQTGWLFSETNSATVGKVNINLPPEIKRPERVAGVRGSALKFNGSNFLSLGDIGDFEHSDEFSIGAWIKSDRRLDRNAGLLARRNGELAREGYDLFLQPNGKIGFRMVGERRLGNMEVVTRSRINPSKWQHIMMTYDGSGKAKGVRIYLNGRPQQLVTVLDTLHRASILNGNDFLVGNWNHRARKSDERWGFSGGSIDEPIVIDRQISSIEVQQIYGSGTTSVASYSDDDLREYYYLNISQKHRELKDQLQRLRAKDLTIPAIMVMEERDTIKPTFVLDRGAYDAHGQLVHRATPKDVLPFSSDLPQDRLGLSMWLFDRENPLTARVFVNRIWQLCFGKGIVATPEDFGSQGKLPTHPKLLDYLSVEFIESGWDIKKLLKTILLSATYKQSSESTTAKIKKDPENLFLSRGPHQTLTAEMLRDQALSVSGLLNAKIGGKWVKFYQPPGIWKALANQIGENKYRPSEGDDLYRRSLYNYWKRTIPPPTLLTLDAPERSVCTVKRQSTSTPLQALILLNDPTYVEAARALSEKVLHKFGTDDMAPSIVQIFQLFTSRVPLQAELQELQILFDQLKLDFDEGSGNAAEWLEIGAAKPDLSLPQNVLAALTAVTSTILNLDESKHR